MCCDGDVFQVNFKKLLLRDQSTSFFYLVAQRGGMAIIMKDELLLSYMNKKAYLNRVPLTAVIELLTLCNFKCEHCYIPHRTSLGMKTDVVKNLLNDLRKIGTLSVLFTGGEIFLRDDIFEIIAYARSLHMRVTLLSNASLLNKNKIEQLSRLHISEFSTTVFSLIPDVNDAITGRADSLRPILDNLELLKCAHIKVRVKMPIMKKNVASYELVRDYCMQNQFEFMPSFSISSKLDGEDSAKDLRVEKEDLYDLVRKAEKDGVISVKSSIFKNDPCSSIFCAISIDCKGDVFPCNSIPFKVGNIYEDSISDIWNQSEKLRYIQGIKKSDLHECIDCKYEHICERCPGMALLEGKGLLSCDPLAKRVAEVRMQNCLLY